MSELKPCPFCGGEPRLMDVPPAHDEVVCPSCVISMPRCNWNRRTSSPPDQEAVERLIAENEQLREALRGALHMLDAHCENVGESLEPEDAAILENYRTALSSKQEGE